MLRDTCRDSKHVKIMFEQGLDQLALCSALDQFNPTQIACFEKGKRWSQRHPPLKSGLDWDVGQLTSAQPQIWRQDAF